MALIGDERARDPSAMPVLLGVAPAGRVVHAGASDDGRAPLERHTPTASTRCMRCAAPARPRRCCSSTAWPTSRGKLVEAEASGASITPTAVRFRQRARATGDQHHDMQNPAAAARWLKAAAQVDPEVEAPAKP